MATTNKCYSKKHLPLITQEYVVITAIPTSLIAPPNLNGPVGKFKNHFDLNFIIRMYLCVHSAIFYLLFGYMVTIHANG